MSNWQPTRLTTLYYCSNPIFLFIRQTNYITFNLMLISWDIGGRKKNSWKNPTTNKRQARNCKPISDSSSINRRAKAYLITWVRLTPNRSLTNPNTGPEFRFIISDWISGSSIFDKSLGSKSKEGVDFLPHSFQDSSSSSSTTSSRSSVIWTLRFPASAKLTKSPFGEKMRGRMRMRTAKMEGMKALQFAMVLGKGRDRVDVDGS